MDNLTPEQRTKAMKSIKSSDTGIERKLRKALWDKGYRYRKNCSQFIGKPDIVFIKDKIAVFCDSEFWHGYNIENIRSRIGTNREYWIKKIERNVSRDEEVNKSLKEQGWIVLRFWGNDIKKNLDMCICRVESELSKRRMDKNELR